MNQRNKTIIFTSFSAALTAIGAFIKIPLPHIPITLQTFFVMMSGNLLTTRMAVLSQLIYLGIGLLGIPIFAYGGGIAYIFQPSFGYILSYPVAAFVIALIVERFDKKYVNNKLMVVYRYFSLLLTNILGIIIFFIFGLGYLYFNIKYNLYLHLDQVVSLAGLNIKSAIFILYLNLRINQLRIY